MVAIVKIFLSIITGTVFMFAGLSPAIGFNLLRNRITPDKGTTYSFGYHYTYDNAGSRWNHDRAYRHNGYHSNHFDKHHDYDHKRYHYKRHHHKPYRYHSRHIYRHKTEHDINRFKWGYRSQFQRSLGPQ